MKKKKSGKNENKVVFIIKTCNRLRDTTNPNKVILRDVLTKKKI